MPDSNSVELLLLRHGIAEERLNGLDHPDRALTAKGRSRTAAVATALVQRGLRVDQLFSSPYRRAMQTAQIAVEAGLAPSLAIHNALQPGAEPRSLIPQLKGRVCLVGHEPDLSGLAADLLGLPFSALTLKKAGLIQLQGVGSHWQLQALVRPALLLDPTKL